jgi:hypothetical protein
LLWRGDRAIGTVGRVAFWIVPIGLWIAFQQPIAVLIEIPRIALPLVGEFSPEPLRWYPSFGGFLGGVIAVVWLIGTFGAALVSLRRRRREPGFDQRPL